MLIYKVVTFFHICCYQTLKVKTTFKFLPLYNNYLVATIAMMFKDFNLLNVNDGVDKEVSTRGII